MNPFIEKRTVWKPISTLSCNHPRVEKIWFTGAISAHGVPQTTILCLHILFKDGTRKDFESDKIISEDLLLAKAEEFLQSTDDGSNPPGGPGTPP